MRAAAVLLFGVVAIAALPSPSYAVSLGGGRVEAAPSQNIIQVDRRCGPGRRWVHSRRDRSGRLIRGHCVRVRRR